MTFYRTCIYICLALIVFNFCILFIDGLGAFDSGSVSTVEGIGDENDALNNLTDLDAGDDADVSMYWFWGVLITGGGAGFLVAFLTKQIAPAGAIIFGTVFWASYIKMWTIIDVGSVISSNLPGFLIIFTVVNMFLFIAAVIGMFTGSG